MSSEEHKAGSEAWRKLFSESRGTHFGESMPTRVLNTSRPGNPRNLLFYIGATGLLFLAYTVYNKSQVQAPYDSSVVPRLTKEHQAEAQERRAGGAGGSSNMA